MLCMKFGTVFVSFSLSNLFCKVKIDTDIGIFQNNTTIVANAVLELFVKNFATTSIKITKHKGKNTIQYNNVAEVRENARLLWFLNLLLP